MSRARFYIPNSGLVTTHVIPRWDIIDPSLVKGIHPGGAGGTGQDRETNRLLFSTLGEK